MAKNRSGGRRPFKFDLKKLLLTNLFRLTVAVLPYAVSLGFAFLLFFASFAFAQQSDLFTLRQVIIGGRAVSEQSALRFAGLKVGEKILSIDLSRVERTVLARNPEFKQVMVRRVLPDEVRIFIKKRVPLAQMKQGNVFYMIDSDGIIVSDASSVPFAPLPEIRGAKVAKGDLRKGARLDRYSLNQGVQLLRDIHTFDVLKGHRLTALDITDQNNFLLWIDDKIEVRLASRNFTAQIQKISDALANIEMDPEKIGYIDLRFDDVVVGQK